jgi:steroid delta-isomerase-like uncharacterized protein
MVGILLEVEALERVVLAVQAHLNNGKSDGAIARFAEKFSFKDHGIGLEFKDKARLAEFFQKAWELFPGSLLQAESIVVSRDRVITEWTLKAYVTEPFYAGLTRRVRVSVRGASIVQFDNGKIVAWSDYYDGLTSRRAALASYFTEPVEL